MMIERIPLWPLLLVTLALPAHAADDTEKDQPGFALKTRAKTTAAMDATEASILANIDNQKMILELEPDTSSDYPKLMLALADFYWDLSEVYFRRSESDALEQRIFDADEAGDTDAAQRATAEQEALRAQQRTFQVKTVAQYRRVITDFPRAKDLDEFRYYLGYHLSSMGETDEGLAAYQDLITYHPNSSYVPDALVNIGEFYFDENAYADALQLYEAVEQFPDAPIVSYAIYKQAWCHYNLGDYKQALDRLVEVIRQAEQLGSRAIGLREEASRELIYPYAKVGKPSAALAFFKKFVPDSYLKLAGRLAELYTEQTEYNRSDKLLRSLVKEALDRSDTPHLAVSFQRQIVDNQHRQANKRTTVEEVRELIRIFEMILASAPTEFLEKEAGEVANRILAIATGYHREFESTRDGRTLRMTQHLYDEYLRLFKAGENIYEITMNNAKLMVLTAKYKEAAREFEKVISLDPKGKHADLAAEQAVIAYLKSIEVKNQAVTNEAESDLTRRPLDDESTRFISAVDRWMMIVARDGPNPKSASNIAPARYLAAKLLYGHNHFKEAAERFAGFVERHPRHELIEEAARHVLSCFSLDRDADSLKRYAEAYGANARLMATAVREDVRRIKNEFDYLSCFDFEKREERRAAAECFLKYAEDYPEHERAPSSIYNAGVNYFKARLAQKALEAYKRLYETHAEDELAPKALYSIGEVYRQTTVYDQAAYIYEFFVSNHRNHPLANKALRYASIFRKTLGHYDKAIANLTRYLRMFPDEPTAPRVHLDVITILEAQSKPGKVLKAIKKHLKRYADEAAGLRLQVLLKQAKAHRAIGKSKDARRGYQATVDLFRGLDADTVRALDMVSISAVAEAHFNQGEVILEQAQGIALKGDEKRLQSAIAKKLKLMNEAKSIYEKVMAYRHPGWTIAAHAQLGLAYRDLADAVENADVPRKLRRFPEAVEEYKTAMAERASPIRERALGSYRKALEIARRDHWFNVYSEKAEAAIAQMDLQDSSIKEFRIRPDRVQPNAGLPVFMEDAR